MIEEIQKAIQILNQGGIVIFPTDTAFGVGCRIDNKEAIKRLFAIRKRPETKATPVLVDTVTMAQKYLLPIPKSVLDNLIEPYWPGALTIVLESRIDNVPGLVRGGSGTLGVRIPNHAITRALIRGVGVPILGPSANFHGNPTAYQFEKLDPEFVKLVDYVIKGECSVCNQSTVVDCSQKPWKILREGAIKIQNSKVKMQNYNSKIKSNIILIIDTSSNQEIVVGMQIDGNEYVKKEHIGVKRAQAVLPMVDQLLKQHKKTTADITDISVKTGPGSYTGLRVGIAIANAFAYALQVPINGKKTGGFVEPRYE